MKTIQITIVAAVLALMAISAQAGTLAPAKESTQAALLQSQNGKQVELILKSGQSVGGKVAFVGDNVVHLTSLTGKEMYEASVSLGDISAVVVRTGK